jgi:hypothetical protein
MTGRESCFDALATHCPLLQILSFSKCKVDTTASLVHLLQSCSLIEVVFLDPTAGDHNQGATDEHVAAILKHCTNLKAFHAPSGLQISDATLAAMASRMQSLRYLCLSCCDFESDISMLALAQHCGNLVTFELWSQEGDDISQAALTALVSNLKSVTELSFDHCQLSDQVLCAIAARCPRLQRLHLYGCTGFTAEGVGAVAVSCAELQLVACSEDDAVITHLGRWLWNTIRPGIKFAHKSYAAMLWQRLMSIERKEVAVW